VVKFLIDECLSLDLVDVARDRGFTQSSHVVWLRRSSCMVPAKLPPSPMKVDLQSDSQAT
jgi:hypothetical protein